MGTALGTVRISSNTSRLAEYPLDISSGREHVSALSSAIASFGALIQELLRNLVEWTRRLTPAASKG
jgi:starvation-inducible DNA-binding protein